MPFSPLDLGPSLWLAADTATYQDAARTIPAAADGDPVGGWADQSGAGHHASQSTAGARPTLRLGELNGRPVLRFDGVDDSFPAFDIDTATRARSIAIVARKRSPASAVTPVQTNLFDFDNYLGNAGLTTYGGYSETEWVWRFAEGGVHTPVGIPLLTWTVLTAVVESTSVMRFYANDTLVTTLDPDPAVIANDVRISFSALQRSDVDIAEVVLVNRPLTAPERTDLDTYLYERYFAAASITRTLTPVTIPLVIPQLMVTMGSAPPAGLAFVFTPAKVALGAAELNPLAQDWRILLVGTLSSCESQQDAQYVGDLTALDEFGGAGYARVALSGEQVTRDDDGNRAWINAAVATWPGLGAGPRPIANAILYRHVGSDAANPLIACLGRGGSSPLNGNGSTFTLTWQDPSGLLRIV